MLHAQDMYNHIHRYSESCFFHQALELILDTLYPVMQHHMINWRNPALMNYLDLAPTTAGCSREHTNSAIDVDAATE